MKIKNSFRKIKMIIIKLKKLKLIRRIKTQTNLFNITYNYQTLINIIFLKIFLNHIFVKFY